MDVVAHHSHQAAAGPQDRINAEFLGLARVYRSRMLTAAEPIGRAMRDIAAAAFATYQRRRQGSSLRPETLLAIEAEWRAISRAGCLGQIIKRERRSLTVEDIRIAPATVGNEAWHDQTEASLCIVINRLIITPRKISSEGVTVASVSLHGLGRRIQRGFDNSDDAITRDFALIAAAAPRLLALDDRSFVVETGSGGKWRGAIDPFRDTSGVERRTLNIRTFV
jgi:hypothetical protein